MKFPTSYDHNSTVSRRKGPISRPDAAAARWTTGEADNHRTSVYPLNPRRCSLLANDPRPDCLRSLHRVTLPLMVALSLIHRSSCFRLHRAL